MSFTYNSVLDSLALEPLDQVSSYISEEAAAADLALWTNAKFTHDTTPGHGLHDDKTTSPTIDLDKVMYDTLAQYLDIDLTPHETTRHPTLLPKPTTHSPADFLLPSSPDLIPNQNKKRLATDSSSGDDDKRRRNTAASARFRRKKKEKEQAMAQNVRDMTDKTEKLQTRVHELENEIKWLRELLLEKNSKSSI